MRVTEKASASSLASSPGGIPGTLIRELSLHTSGKKTQYSLFLSYWSCQDCSVYLADRNSDLLLHLGKPRALPNKVSTPFYICFFTKDRSQLPQRHLTCTGLDSLELGTKIIHSGEATVHQLCQRRHRKPANRKLFHLWQFENLNLSQFLFSSKLSIKFVLKEKIKQYI